MKLEKLHISADGYNLSYLAKLSENTDIYRIHIGCIEDNYKAIEKSAGIENAVVHILINRIDSIERLKQKLIDFDVKRILLLTGNPHPKPFKHTFTEIIKQLKDIVNIYVAAYPTSYFYFQNGLHISKQIKILKEKIETGASEVYLQNTYNIKKLKKFQHALNEFNIKIPVHYGISPKISLQKIVLIIKELIPKFYIMLKFRNLDFVIRLLKTNNNKSVEFITNILNNSNFRSEDGFHLTTLDSTINDLLMQVRTNNQGDSFSKID